MKAKDPAAVALGSKKSKKKAAAARINGAKGGRPLKNYPQKRHTFDCKIEGCKVTIPHEHLPTKQ